MNSSTFAAGKMHIAFALCALCAMILAPLALVKGQALPQGTLTVEKEIVGTTTVPASDFSFVINGATTTFEADGSNQVTLDVGTYSVTEVAANGYATTYAGCDSIELTATNSPVCTITNTVTAAPATGTLTVNKVIVGTTTAAADDFSFFINGTSSTQFEADGSNEVTLQTGTYDITEAQANGYTTTYAGCDAVVLTATNSPVCTITNTASATPTTATGTLIVEKMVNGGPSATSSFSFLINGGATTTFESDGSNAVVLDAGTYSVTEVPAANYTPTYSNCSNVDVIAGTTTTCTITNNFNVGGGQLYEITGIVWDDENEDGVLDSGESRLENWTVSASQTGEITRTDTTDANGRYTLLVTGGSWLVSQTTQADWDQTFPSGGTHTVNATGTATTTIPLGDYNFGNDRDESSGGGGGGNGIRIELRDDNDDDDDNNSGGGRSDDDEDEDEDDDDNDGGSGFTTPPGQVLGAQTTAYPYGAPDTGFGGMSSELHKMDAHAAVPLLGTVFALLLGLGIFRGMKEESTW